jgi:hypothetical protein
MGRVVNAAKAKRAEAERKAVAEAQKMAGRRTGLVVLSDDRSRRRDRASVAELLLPGLWTIRLSRFFACLIDTTAASISGLFNCLAGGARRMRHLPGSKC